MVAAEQGGYLALLLWLNRDHHSGKGPLEIDCIDFIAFAGKRRGGNHFPPITLFYVCALGRGETVLHLPADSVGNNERDPKELPALCVDKDVSSGQVVKKLSKWNALK